MKKNVLHILAALVSLLVLSCAKQDIHPAEGTPAVPEDPWTVILAKEESAPDGPVTRLTAGFAPTKAGLVMNPSRTFAAQHWESGDQFRMFGFTSDLKNISHATYSTTESGASVEFTGSTIPDTHQSHGLFCLYPNSAYTTPGKSSGKPVIRAVIPQEQTAREGTADPAALISTAYLTNQSDKLHFYPFVSLIKFSLKGANVSKITSIEFNGYATASGSVSIGLDADKKPEYLSNTSFAGDVKHRDVKLIPPTGETFKTDTDYYIAIAPGTHDGFSMVFKLYIDGETKTITKTSSMNVAFNRSQITDFGELTPGTDYDTPYVPYLYTEATASAPKPVTMVVLPDGYTKDELTKFRTDATLAMNTLFATAPYKAYKEYFNVWFLDVASEESGANITDGYGNITTARKCFFGSKWGEDSYDDMEANDEKIFAFVEKHCPDFGVHHPIEEIPVLLIINDARYGGRAHRWSNGMTYCMAPKTGGEISWSYAMQGFEAASVNAEKPNTKTVTNAERIELGRSSGTWINTMVHEYGGHSFGRLLDEYWYGDATGSGSKTPVTSINEHSYDPPYGLNISASPATTPWDALLTSEGQAMLTATGKTQYGRIGIFQGGHVSMFNRWRSEKVSCMIDNRLYFSTWQRWVIANRIMTLAGLSALTLEEFLAKDVATDPLRDDVGMGVMRADGVSDKVPPRPRPMLPPPVFHED